jgi:hypothetical protein
LTATVVGMMYVPVVAATWFEGHIGEWYLPGRDSGQVAGAGEIFGIGIVRFPYRELLLSAKLILSD